ncbi:alpha/beta fold hydrolase [Phycicoccus sp. Soil803]|uniref:alpha/beta fold hydrolase n=1 Tax=Phycicoccus sp. Soil803 TaxID=1736415 RepID=UPI00070A17E5|nr:alpha/beta hydrolase [Phycicoccus sp. Soil803]KRF25971.1 hypothetical protein ASG95_16960 [Phycicoccus sp. Soil803]
MAEPELIFTRLAGEAGRGHLLVVGPSLGTSVEALWGAAARVLGESLEVVGWDLPGHGRSAPTAEPFTVEELASAVRRTTNALMRERRRDVSYAGVSLGGAVALCLALEPGPFAQVACIAGAARIGQAAGWQDRARLVRRAGTPVVVSGSAERWFAPGFVDRDPAAANRLLLSLSDADDESYALACEALATFDLRARLGEVGVPLLVVAGEHDVVVTLDLAEATAVAAPGSRVEVMAGCAHLPPAEDPVGTAAVVLEMVKENARG